MNTQCACPAAICHLTSHADGGRAALAAQSRCLLRVQARLPTFLGAAFFVVVVFFTCRPRQQRRIQLMLHGIEAGRSKQGAALHAA